MNKNRIIRYNKNSFLNYISEYYKPNYYKSQIIYVEYFYWLYKNIYIRNMKGLSTKINFKRYNNMISFLIYYKYKNIKINQLYFIASPFNIFFKFKVSNSKKYKLYIL